MSRSGVMTSTACYVPLRLQANLEKATSDNNRHYKNDKCTLNWRITHSLCFLRYGIA